MNETNKAKLNSAVIIPALNPIPELVAFVQELLAQGTARVIVVNDGSAPSFNAVFDAVKRIDNCTVLDHKINRGKGRALKTAFSYFLENCPDLDGVVTADADGQHSVKDIRSILEMLSRGEKSLILGVRDFNDPNVPRRSYIGNTITSRFFQLLYGYYLSDTQTGLRGIPTGQIPWMMELSGERYEYEINVLIKAVRFHVSFITTPIETLYFDNNAGSHYDTIRDSFRIFKCLVAGLWNHQGECHEKRE